MEAYIDAGLGLDHDELRLDRTSEGWVVAGSSLRDEVAASLEREVEDVEQVGSSSVLGLLAKPIIDLAVGLSEHHELLRRNSDARSRYEYEAVKRRLIEEFGDDRKAYTDGKSDVVRSLLSNLGQTGIERP